VAGGRRRRFGRRNRSEGKERKRKHGWREGRRRKISTFFGEGTRKSQTVAKE
jgi:hypothetical protein